MRHNIPLLSLAKTKAVSDLASFLKGHAALLMLKLDGLTVKLVYEDGRLAEASTRGDGEEGENVTHNIAAFRNVPLSIPYKERLVITGEGFIHKSDFERLKDRLTGSDGKPYRNARNLASGSIRSLDAAACREREVSFCAFNVLEGLAEFEDSRDSRSGLLSILAEFGFEVCPAVYIPPDAKADHIESKIQKMTELADSKVCGADFDIPIDGMVLRFDSFSYSAGLGRTGHHYNDGIAFKFEDDTYETVFRTIEWQTGRSGEIAPVALFDTVEIDGCEVSRASLHNLTFIKGLELHPGCRILVSKEGMIVKTLFYHDEIAAVPKQVPKVTLDRNELDMAKMLVDSMTKPFVPEDFKDEYQARLRDAIMKKIQGKEIVTADNSEPGNVIDLMEALQKSLEMSSGKKKKGTA